MKRTLISGSSVSRRIHEICRMGRLMSPELWRNTLADDRGVLRSRACGRGESGG